MLRYINTNFFDTSIVSTMLNVDIINHNTFDDQTFKSCFRRLFKFYPTQSDYDDGAGYST